MRVVEPLEVIEVEDHHGDFSCPVTHPLAQRTAISETCQRVGHRVMLEHGDPLRALDEMAEEIAYDPDGSRGYGTTRRTDVEGLFSADVTSRLLSTGTLEDLSALKAMLDHCAPDVVVNCSAAGRPAPTAA